MPALTMAIITFNLNVCWNNTQALKFEVKMHLTTRNVQLIWPIIKKMSKNQTFGNLHKKVRK